MLKIGAWSHIQHRGYLPVMSTSRRAFIGAGAATAAHVWVPKPVKGYTAGEIMTPLPDVFMIPKDLPYEELVARYRRYRRYLRYQWRAPNPAHCGSQSPQPA